MFEGTLEHRKLKVALLDRPAYFSPWVEFASALYPSFVTRNGYVRDIGSRASNLVCGGKTMIALLRVLVVIPSKIVVTSWLLPFPDRRLAWSLLISEKKGDDESTSRIPSFLEPGICGCLFGDSYTSTLLLGGTWDPSTACYCRIFGRYRDRR